MNDPSVASARPAWKDIGYGSVAGMISKVFEHPFDLVKVRLQSQPLDRPARFIGPIDCFRQTFNNEGLRGLYRGLSMPVLGAMAENATLFVVYGQTQNLLRRFFPSEPQSGASSPSSISPSSSSSSSPSDTMPLAQLAFAGAVAGAVTSFVLTPIELVKVRMQVQMIAQEQIATLQPSQAMSVPASSVTKAAGAGARAGARAGAGAGARAGAGAGAGAGAALRPPLPGPVKLFRSVLQQHGFKGLWLGQTGTFLRETGGSMAWFAAFEGVSRFFIAQRQQQVPLGSVKSFTKDDLSSPELMLAGACAGAAYTVVLFPADCIKSTIQTSDELRKSTKGGVAEPTKGFLQTGKDIYAARGVKGLYSGCGVTIVRSAPSSAIIFLLYSLLERQFG